MTFDIIEITDEEVELLGTVRLKLLRTAQKKKNALYHKLEEELAERKRLAYSNGMEDSSLYAEASAELIAEYEYQVEIIREQLTYDMAIAVSKGDTDEPGYVVDYELSYLYRYINVRDYYMTIEDPYERLALYSADEVAYQYLDSYYNSLYDYFVSLTKRP